jgi:hypothetical protein
MQNNDPQTIWKNQNTQEIKMSLAYFKTRADQQRFKNLWMAIANDVIYLAVVAFLGFTFLRTPNLTSRLGLAMLAAGSLYTLYRGHRRLWPGSPASDTSPDSGLAVYRRELLRSHATQSNGWRTLAPLFPGAIVLAVPALPPIVRAASANPSILINSVPFFVILAVWAVLMTVVRKRWLKKVQQELDALARS